MRTERKCTSLLLDLDPVEPVRETVSGVGRDVGDPSKERTKRVNVADGLL